MAMNAADTHIHSFTDQLLPLVVEKQMGIIGMKVPARGRLLTTWTPPPLETAAAFMGRLGNRDAPRRNVHARRRAIHADAPCKHSDRRLRQHCAA
jgi:hypothetical protein